jgi:hypothetical protein
MDHYIIRIYRRVENDARLLVGTVEEVETQEKRAFSSLQDLWSILNQPKKHLAKDEHR